MKGRPRESGNEDRSRREPEGGKARMSKMKNLNKGRSAHKTREAKTMYRSTQRKGEWERVKARDGGMVREEGGRGIGSESEEGFYCERRVSCSGAFVADV